MPSTRPFQSQPCVAPLGRPGPASPPEPRLDPSLQAEAGRRADAAASAERLRREEAAAAARLQSVVERHRREREGWEREAEELHARAAAAAATADTAAAQLVALTGALERERAQATTGPAARTAAGAVRSGPPHSPPSPGATAGRTPREPLLHSLHPGAASAPPPGTPADPLMQATLRELLDAW